MELTDAEHVVRMLSAAYPTYPVSTDTADLYVEMIAPRAASAEIAYAAARKWINEQPHFPRVSELLAEIRLEQRRLSPLALLPPPERPEQTDAAKQIVAEARQKLRMTQGEPDDHGQHARSAEPGATA